MRQFNWEHSNRLKKELSRSCKFWVGDTLEDRNGTRWEIDDVAFSVEESGPIYKIGKYSEPRSDWRSSGFVEQMEVIEEANRPAPPW